MQLNVFINESVEVKFNYQHVIETLEKTISENVSASLILVDINEIQEINRDYRQKDAPTDVISCEEEDDEDETYIGDIFICVEKVHEQAEAYGHSLEREFAFLIVHGVLHLMGYDHIEKDDEVVMFAKQDEILNKTEFRRNK